VGELAVLDAIYRQDAPWVCQDADGEFRLASPLPRLLFPGSFNPLHHGHTTLADRARERLGSPVAYELSVINVDKPELPPMEVARRLEQFRGRDPVYVSRAPTFQQKAALFPNCTFVVGADTALRVVDPRFYGGDLGAMLRALQQIRDTGCHFFVGGRVDSTGSFVEVGDIVIPPAYRDLFTGLSEQVFRVDVSSTALRASRSER
jgi:Cytidylyltransferase-like